MNRKTKKIVIIGGGFSGVISAIEVMRRIREPANILLVERQSGNIGGIAYGQQTADFCHETNLPASIMLPNIYADPEKVANDCVMKRHEVGKELTRSLGKAAEEAETKKVKLKTIFNNVVDIIDMSGNTRKKEHGLRIVLENGGRIEADYAVIATGNDQQRELPSITAEKQADAEFSKYYISNQWSAEAREKIDNIPKHAPVLVIGTAMSSYDAVRSLLHRGHKGPIVMMSRHGLEHFQYESCQKVPDADLPPPAFMKHILEPEKALDSMVREFGELTGLRIDLKKMAINKTSFVSRLFNRKKYYSPEQVLKQWEKQIPLIVDVYGQKQYGSWIRKYTPLINVLRVGAGHDVCEEINAAKKSGQLTVQAASIDAVDKAENGGLIVSYKDAETGKTKQQYFNTVISSLGPEYDFNHASSPLWRNLIKRGYAHPHPVGVGIKMDTSGTGTARIFAVGTPVSGELMIKEGVLAPPHLACPECAHLFLKPLKKC